MSFKSFVLPVSCLCLAVGALAVNTVSAAESALFPVTKIFSDGSTAAVDATLTCTTGLPLTQSLPISGGDPVGVTFVVTEIEGTVECVVTESGGPSGYTPAYNGGTGCMWTEATLSDVNSCVISNSANPATFTVNKEWVVDNQGGDVIDFDIPVTIWCSNPIIPGNPGLDGYIHTAILGDGGSVSVEVSTLLGPALCSATENVSQSGVESSGCEDVYEITAGGSASCTFTNSVFFEGIPTLNQYGLALLALLMLGVGMIGFRRFA